MEDRSWIYDMLAEFRTLRHEYIIGVYGFINKAIQHPQCRADGGIRCPCSKCECEKMFDLSTTREHLLRHGFKPKWVWTDHGEDFPITPEAQFMAESSGVSNMDYEDHFAIMHQMVNNALRPIVDMEQETFNDE